MVKLFRQEVGWYRSHYHLWPVRILCQCCSSDGCHQGKPTLLSIPGSFHSPMPTPEWSSVLLDRLILLIMWFLSRWGHSAQQQGLGIFTGSLLSPVAYWPRGPEPRTDFWLLLDLVPFVTPSDQTPPFFGHYCLSWPWPWFHIPYKQKNFHKNAKQQGH